MSATVTQAIAGFSPRLPLGVGYSGGADSTALLLACAKKWPGQVTALHINHGLQAAAGDFQAHCAAVCQRIRVPLRVLRVNADAARGQSPEDAARQARYTGLLALGQGDGEFDATKPAITSIALAQHADDQVETMLLALSRGAGLAGMSAMPMAWQRGGVDFHRPLLRVPGAAIREWLAVQEEGWFEDPSNTDLHFTRNHIRARLLPALQEVFPQFRDTFARSSMHAAQAQGLLDEIAQQDFAAVAPLGVHPTIAALQTFSPARQANVLRYWLKTIAKTTHSTAQLAELINQIAHCTTRGHHINIKVGAGFVTRQGDGLAWYNP